MKILALDVGKSKSVAYRLDTETGEVGFKAILTQAESFVRLVAEGPPKRPLSSFPLRVGRRSRTRSLSKSMGCPRKGRLQNRVVKVWSMNKR